MSCWRRGTGFSEVYETGRGGTRVKSGVPGVAVVESQRLIDK